MAARSWILAKGAVVFTIEWNSSDLLKISSNLNICPDPRTLHENVGSIDESLTLFVVVMLMILGVQHT